MCNKYVWYISVIYTLFIFIYTWYNLIKSQRKMDKRHKSTIHRKKYKWLIKWDSLPPLITNISKDTATQVLSYTDNENIISTVLPGSNLPTCTKYLWHVSIIWSCYPISGNLRKSLEMLTILFIKTLSE